MPARLIINADDFGLTRGINRAVEQLHRTGVLTSATLMATGPAFNDAVAIAHRNPNLGIGCHVVLSDGTPLAPPASIPSLLAPDRLSLRPSLLRFAIDALRGQLRPEDIRTEALAQIRKLQAAGLHLTHLDTHKHTHLFPGVSLPLLEVAHLTGIPAIRNPFEPSSSRARSPASRLRHTQIRLLNTLRPRFQPSANAIATTDGTLGIAATGHLDRNTLTRILTHLPTSGTWELVCHPGENDADLDRITTRLRSHRDIERLALFDVLPKLLAQPGAPTLIHYGDLPAPRRRQTPERQP